MTDAELAAILRGDPPGEVDYRQAVADLHVENVELHVLLERQSWFESYRALAADTDLLAHVLVDALSA